MTPPACEARGKRFSKPPERKQAGAVLFSECHAVSCTEHQTHAHLEAAIVLRFLTRCVTVCEPADSAQTPTARTVPTFKKQKSPGSCAHLEAAAVLRFLTRRRCRRRSSSSSMASRSGVGSFRLPLFSAFCCLHGDSKRVSRSLLCGLACRQQPQQ